MTIRHKGAAIAVWVLCAVLIAVIVLLVLYLRCCRRQNALQLRRRQRHHHTTTSESNTNEVKIREWELSRDTTLDALRGHAADAGRLFDGFRRRTTEELEALPSPAAAPSFTCPLSVHLRVRPDQAYAEACDILLTVDRLRDSMIGDRSEAALLGNDAFYTEDFLLYTSPLEFTQPGTYVIRAFTVHGRKAIVGAVHQFLYVVVNSAHPLLTSTSGVMNSYMNPSAGMQNRNSNIDIDIARRLASRGDVQAFDAVSGVSPMSPAMLRYAADAPNSTAAVPPSDSFLNRPPPAPVITPSGGEVTTSTDIVISTNEFSITADQLRYSVDGSFPTLLYSGPFQLSLPPPSLLPSQRLQIVIQAVAVRTTLNGNGSAMNARSPSVASNTSRHAMQANSSSVSAVTRVVVQVGPAGHSYYDPAVPTPSLRLRATNATLYFDESQNQPHTQTVYDLVYINEVRGKVRYNRNRTQVYTGEPIPLPEDVATVHAWTVATDDSPSSSSSADRLRSVPSIYDCSRGAKERGRLSRSRMDRFGVTPEDLLPAPVMCIACGEMAMAFDGAPANAYIAYTLNDTEPALCDVYPPACAVSSHVATAEEEAANRARHRRYSLDRASPIVGDHDGAHTHLYEPGKRIPITPLETAEVFVTARVFVPVFESTDGTLYGNSGAQGGSGAGNGKLLGYRYGGVFHRGFYFDS